MEHEYTSEKFVEAGMRGAPEERFWAKVEKERGPSACWLWTASRDTKGYGHFGTGPKSESLVKAHRFSWELHIGPIPLGQRLFHLCGNHACVRPDHLYVGPHAMGRIIDMTPDLRDFLDGLLLGDGTYRQQSSISGLFQIGQRTDRKRWLLAIEAFLAQHGIELRWARRPAKVINFRGQDIHSSPSYFCWSLSYRTLLAERLRWYPRGKKRVPPDINLSSPVLLAQWYMGDGSIWQPSANNLQVNLHTEGLPKTDVLRLQRNLLAGPGLRASINHSSRKRGRKPILLFCGSAARKFIDLVRPHIVVPPFGHKLPRRAT
jgi:hypothetical protein